jgi:hypothetical protein
LATRLEVSSDEAIWKTQKTIAPTIKEDKKDPSPSSIIDSTTKNNPENTFTPKIIKRRRDLYISCLYKKLSYIILGQNRVNKHTQIKKNPNLFELYHRTAQNGSKK